MVWQMLLLHGLQMFPGGPTLQANPNCPFPELQICPCGQPETPTTVDPSALMASAEVDVPGSFGHAIGSKCAVCAAAGSAPMQAAATTTSAVAMPRPITRDQAITPLLTAILTETAVRESENKRAFPIGRSPYLPAPVEIGAASARNFMLPEFAGKKLVAEQCLLISRQRYRRFMMRWNCRSFRKSLILLRSTASVQRPCRRCVCRPRGSYHRGFPRRP